MTPYPEITLPDGASFINPIGRLMLAFRDDPAMERYWAWHQASKT